ncbi:MAG: hypothetical protein SOZ62_03375 [Eubacteriales bacterium]|nr:hypothetical protein [Eubacteriales bacterium]
MKYDEASEKYDQVSRSSGYVGTKTQLDFEESSYNFSRYSRIIGTGLALFCLYIGIRRSGNRGTLSASSMTTACQKLGVLVFHKEKEIRGPYHDIQCDIKKEAK